jgi:virulence-associated protein VapD
METAMQINHLQKGSEVTRSLELHDYEKSQGACFLLTTEISDLTQIWIFSFVVPMTNADKVLQFYANDLI